MCDFLAHYLKENENISTDAFNAIFFFLEHWLGIKTKAHYVRKIFLRHFWKLKFCCATLSTCPCVVATPISRFFSITHTRDSPHLILPLLSRFPNILWRFYSASYTYVYMYTRLAGRINIFVSVNRIRYSPRHGI